MFALQTLTLVLPILLPGALLIAVLKTNIFSILDTPIDHGIIFKNRPLIGRNKTYRGVIIYILGSLVATIILWTLKLYGADWVHWLFVYNPIILGFMFGLSYSLGEIINSFVKRRIGIKPGDVNKRFSGLQYFFDLADGPIMVTIILMAIYGFSWQSVAALFSGVFIHWMAEILMFKLHIKKKH